MSLHRTWPLAFTLLALFAINVCVTTQAASAEDPQRPNIVFAFADDWGRFASSYAKVDGPGTINDVVRTPNFDRIAQRGVLFRDAFVNSPSCTPCRSSLLAGQHFWRTGRGAILQGAKWDDAIPTWPLLLRDSGYHLGKTWKVWSPGTPADAPIGQQRHAFQKAGGRFNQFSQHATRMVDSGRTVDDAKRELLEEVRGNIRAFLAARTGKQPFCYWFGPTNVHRAWVRGSGKKLWGIEPDSLKGKLPPFLPDVSEVREDLADYLGEIAAFDAALGVLVEELESAGQLSNTLLAVSGDHGPPGFPHGKCNLYDFGTRVALAIAGPGIVGNNAVGNRVVDDFVSLPDLAPTFLAAGNVDLPKQMTARTLWPVLKSDKSDKSDKSGQVDPERTRVFIGRERHVESAREGNLPYPQRAIRTADYLFVINFKPDRYPLGDPYGLDGDNPPTAEVLARNTFATLADEDAGPAKAWLVTHRDDPKWKPYFDKAYGRRPREELFALKTDPHQMKNVANDPAHAEALAKLRKQLLHELEQTGDPRLIENGKYYETAPLAGPLPDDVNKPPPRSREGR
jgi:N-sulfoglucosamine sulfohydrolase